MQVTSRHNDKVSICYSERMCPLAQEIANSEASALQAPVTSVKLPTAALGVRLPWSCDMSSVLLYLLTLKLSVRY